MIAPANRDFPRRLLLLEMAFQAECLISLGQHAVINRPVRLVAGETAFARGFMFKNKRSPLRGVALEAGLHLRGPGEQAAARGRLYGVVHDGEWFHIGDAAGLKEAEAFLGARYAGRMRR